MEEIDTADPQAEAEKQLGNLQQGAIDIAGNTVVMRMVLLFQFFVFIMHLKL